MTVSSRNFDKQSVLVHRDLRHNGCTSVARGNDESKLDGFKTRLSDTSLPPAQSVDHRIPTFGFEESKSAVIRQKVQSYVIFDKTGTRNKESFEESMWNLVQFIEEKDSRYVFSQDT